MRFTHRILALIILPAMATAQVAATSCPMGLHHASSPEGTSVMSGAGAATPGSRHINHAPEGPRTHAHGSSAEADADEGHSHPATQPFHGSAPGSGGVATCALAMACGPLAPARAARILSITAASILFDPSPAATHASADLRHPTPPPRPVV
jgi:hypothetical protein